MPLTVNIKSSAPFTSQIVKLVNPGAKSIYIKLVKHQGPFQTKVKIIKIRGAYQI